MEGEGRTIPPGDNRVEAAAREGIFPRSRLLPVGFALLGCSAVLHLGGRWMGERLSVLMRDGLEAAVGAQSDPAQHLEWAFKEGISVLVPLLAVALLGSAIPQIIVTVSARRRRGHTSTPLPRDRGPGFRGGLITLTALVLFGLLGFRIMKAGAAELFQAASPEILGGAILDLLVSLFAAAGAIALLAGVAELAWERTRIWRALHLSPSEAARDLRATRGDPRSRARMSQLARRGRSG